MPALCFIHSTFFVVFLPWCNHLSHSPHVFGFVHLSHVSLGECPLSLEGILSTTSSTTFIHSDHGHVPHNVITATAVVVRISLAPLVPHVVAVGVVVHHVVDVSHLVGDEGGGDGGVGRAGGDDAAAAAGHGRGRRGHCVDVLGAGGGHVHHEGSRGDAVGGVVAVSVLELVVMAASAMLGVAAVLVGHGHGVGVGHCGGLVTLYLFSSFIHLTVNSSFDFSKPDVLHLWLIETYSHSFNRSFVGFFLDNHGENLEEKR